MRLQELVAQLAAVERAIHDRIEIWRIVIDVRGNELRRVHGRSFQPRDSRNEPRHSGG
jgi:hypothetical protein